MRMSEELVGGQEAGRRGMRREVEARLRERLRRRTPSEPWVDEQLPEVIELDESGELVVRRTYDRSAFPPGGKQTGMVPCQTCGIHTPPVAMESGNCLDHREEGAWGPSPSALVIQALQYWHLKLPESELLPESEAALKREIELFERNSSESHP